MTSGYLYKILTKVSPRSRTGRSGGFRVVPRVPWNPSFMKVLIILYYDKLTRSVGPVDYIALMEPPTS